MNPSFSGLGNNSYMEQRALDPTVERELDAAMALADLAGVGRSSTKRVKKQSPDKPNCGVHKYSIKSSTAQSSLIGSRARKILSEAEREEKKLRRVLANREAARQTIRRRQALREDLTRKFAGLSLENKNLKMEKEIAKKEYLSLKETNMQLKEEVAIAMKPQEEAPTSSTTLPLMIYSMPGMVVPYVWQSWPNYYEQRDGGPSCACFFPLNSRGPESCTVDFQVSRDQHEQHRSGHSHRTSDEEEKEEVSCSLTLNIEIDKHDKECNGVSRQISNSEKQIRQSCPNKALRIPSCSKDVASQGMSVDAAAARKKRKELLKLKQMNSVQHW